MATPKTIRVQAEIDKSKARIAEEQARLKGLEARRTELENMEIVDIVRGMSIPLDGLADVLRSIRKGPALTSGQVGPKLKAPAPEITEDGEEKRE